GGKDRIAQLAGIPQGKTIIGISAWESATGAGAQTFFPVPLEGAKAKRVIKQVAEQKLRLASAIRAYVLRQDMVVYHTPVFDASVKSQNGIQLLTNRALTPDEIQSLYSALNAKFNTWDLAPGYLPNGARILNFVDGLDNKAFHDGFREILQSLPDDFGGGIVEFGKYRSIGDAVFSNWKDNPNGEVYREIIAAKSSDLLRRADDLRASVEAVNRQFASKYGWDKPATGAALSARDRADVNSAEFKAWSNNAPIVQGEATEFATRQPFAGKAYHGSPVADITEFDPFAPSRFRKELERGMGAIWFGAEPATATNFAGMAGSVYPVYV
ncbi:MAG: hypothetical protein EBX90_08830, partial [Betaproteobacteria bacterium]|nr:hypothetical protein [Betaproteobacteria bacterium]